MSENAKLLRFFELLLKASLRLDFITHRLASPLGIIESYVLAEIALHQRCLATDLVKTLRITKSSVSKVTKTIAEKGWIEVIPSEEDHRQKFIVLTSTGRQVVAEESKIKNRQMVEFVQMLSSKEQREFIELVRKFADGASEPLPRQDTGDHPLRREIQRLTRITGFLGDSLLESGIPYQRCEILFVCGESASGIHMRELNSRLPYDASVISRIISEFEHEGIIQKAISTADKRVVQISLTTKGFKKREQMIEVCTNALSRMIAPLSSDFLDRLLPLLSRAAESSGDFADDIGGNTIREVHSSEERRLARAVAMELLVRQNLHFVAPSYSLAHGHHFYLYSVSGHAAGVLEFRKHGDHYELLLWLYDSALVSIDDAKNFLLEGLRSLKKQEPNMTVVTSWAPLIQMLSRGESDIPPYQVTEEGLLELIQQPNQIAEAIRK